jgi:hypothetical protein
VNNSAAKPQDSDGQEEVRYISRMINANLVFLKYVFILKESEGYRLVIAQENLKLVDCLYKTLQGAKVGSIRFIFNRDPEIDFAPVWSYFYPVDEKWLENKLNQGRLEAPG